MLPSTTGGYLYDLAIRRHAISALPSPSPLEAVTCKAMPLLSKHSSSRRALPLLSCAAGAVQRRRNPCSAGRYYAVARQC